MRLCDLVEPFSRLSGTSLLAFMMFANENPPRESGPLGLLDCAFIVTDNPIRKSAMNKNLLIELQTYIKVLKYLSPSSKRCSLFL
jgi:hypothetical protein